MANVLNEQKRAQVVALGRLGWPLRRIEEATGVRRETASAYLKAAGIEVRRPGWGRRDPDPKPAIQTSTDSGASAGSDPPAPWPPRPGRSPQASACEPYREAIEQALARGRDGAAIYRDLVDDHGFAAGYASVQRFVRRDRKSTRLNSSHVNPSRMPSSA